MGSSPPEGSPQAERRSGSRWLLAMTALFALVAAAEMYGVDALGGRAGWASSGHGFLLIALSHVLAWWRPSVPSQGKRRAITAGQLVFALVGIVWLTLWIRQVNGHGAPGAL
jgi:hypothetical protein